MAENAEAARVWLTLASLAVSVFTLTLLVFIFLLLKRVVDDYFKPKSAPVNPASPPASAAGLVAQRKEQAEAAKPGRSCGHCGVRIKGDPVRGVAFEDKGYLAFVCPKCKKETLIPQ